MATDYVYAIYAEGDYVWFGGMKESLPVTIYGRILIHTYPD